MVLNDVVNHQPAILLAPTTAVENQHRDKIERSVIDQRLASGPLLRKSVPACAIHERRLLEQVLDLRKRQLKALVPIAFIGSIDRTQLCDL